MNNLQEILLFPVRDDDARKQFLLACLAVLAGYIIPILPFLVLMGYSAKVMRQVIDERKTPSMPDWQVSDWSEMLMDGLRLYGAQLVPMLPLFLLVGCGVIATTGGSITMAISAEENARIIAPFGMLLFFGGFAFIMLVALLSFPFSIVLSAVGPHVVTNRSFEAAFRFKEWWQVFRKGFGQFLFGFAVTMAVSFALMLVVQFAMLTIVLMCLVPFLMIPLSAYLTLVTNAIYAQAYLAGRDLLLSEAHASA